jgi:hypothetical protein
MRDDGPDLLPAAADDWDGGWDGEHLREETAHAWLDGALPPDQAARAESHVAACADCAALVAEARGLIAGASRILGALDAVPAGVLPAPMPAAPARVVPAPMAGPAAPPAPRGWWTRLPARAAAAALLLAGGSAVVLRDRGVPSAARQESATSAPEAQPMTSQAPPMAPVAAADLAVEGATLDSAAAPLPTRVRPVRSPALPPAPLIAERAAAPAAEQVAEQVAEQTAAQREERRMDRAAAAKARVAGAPPPLPAPAAPAVASAPAAPTAAADAAQAAGTVAGRVLTPEGRPIAAAQVQLVGGSAGAVTDDSGAFVLRDVRTGPVTLQARRIGFQPQSASVLVTGADTASATVVLRQQASALSGVVLSGAAAGVGAGAMPREEAARAARRAVASLARASAPRAALGCYLLTPLPGAAPALRPTWVALDSVPAAPSGGRPAYRARVVPGGTAAWTPLGGDSLRVTRPGAPDALVLRLRPAGTEGGQLGTAGGRPVTTRRVACDAMPAR